MYKTRYQLSETEFIFRFHPHVLTHTQGKFPLQTDERIPNSIDLRVIYLSLRTIKRAETTTKKQQKAHEMGQHKGEHKEGVH